MESDETNISGDNEEGLSLRQIINRIQSIRPAKIPAGADIEQVVHEVRRQRRRRASSPPAGGRTPTD